MQIWPCGSVWGQTWSHPNYDSNTINQPNLLLDPIQSGSLEGLIWVGSIEFDYLEIKKENAYKIRNKR